MQSILLGSKAIALLSITGTDIIVKALTVTTTTTLNLIKHLTSLDQPSLNQIKKDLEDLDLEKEVLVINAFIEELNEDYYIKNSVKIALENLNSILIKINEEIETIKTVVNDHNEKWFNTWRSFDCGECINNIKQHYTILEKRMDMVIKLLSIRKKD